MKYHKHWRKLTINILKSVLKDKNVSYVDLCDKLKDIGIEEDYSNIVQKVNRGTFSFAFFIQCLEAIGLNEYTINVNKLQQNQKDEATYHDERIAEILKEHSKNLNNHEKELLISILDFLKKEGQTILDALAHVISKRSSFTNNIKREKIE